MPYRQMYRNKRSQNRLGSTIHSSKNTANEVISYLGGLANNDVVCMTGAGKAAATGVATANVGDRIFSIAISMNFVNASAANGGDFSWALILLRSGQSISTEFGATNATSWSTIGISNSRNQVIKSYMGVYGTEDATALRQNVQIRIPKTWQRVREGDVWHIVFNGTDAGTLNTGYRYKVYT